MANTKTTDLAAGTNLDAADLVEFLDVSDTSMDATGTNKKITVANLFTSPTLVTPTIGVATATTLNGLTITTTTGTLTLASGKTATVSNTLTFTGTDSSTIAFGAGGTVAYVANKLSVFAATTSAELAGVISDETGSGALVFATSPTLVTPALGTPASGNLSSCTVDGTNGPGFRGVPQNSKSADYTTVLTDAGKCIFHPVSDNNARTFIIDSNANVAYPVGTVIEFVNMAATSATIVITTDTLILLPDGTTGSRTLAQYGKAHAEKITSTSWTIVGVGLT